MTQINFPVVIICSFTAALFIVLLVVVLLANSKAQINRLFAAYLFSSFIWSLFTAFEAGNVTSFWEYIFNRTVNIFGVFTATITFLVFGLVYLRKPFRFWLVTALVTYIPLSILMLTNKFSYITDQATIDGLRFHSRTHPGDLLFVPLLWGGVLIGVLVYQLIRDLLTSRDKIHLQKAKLLILAVGIGAGSALVFNGIPALWGYPVDILGQLVTAFILTYAILRFELVDVPTKFRNLIVEIILSALLAILVVSFFGALYFFTNQELLLWLGLVTAVFLTSLSEPLKEKVLRFVDLAFYQTRYDYRETINKFTIKVGELLNADLVVRFISSTISQTFNPKNVAVLVKREGSFVQSVSGEKDVSFKIEDFEFENKEITVLPQNSRLAKLGYALVVPLKTGPDLVGWILIGERVSGDLYSKEDINLLFTLSSASAIALKNALLYQEVLENKKRIEKLLLHEREVAENKNEFISLSSHFLRTPLTTIKGYLYLLKEKNLSVRERNEYLLRASSEQVKLATLVEDIFTIASLEKGELTLKKERLSLGRVAKAVISGYESLALEKKVALTLEIRKDFEIMADQGKLAQALANLLSNALKFTAVGKVSVVVSGDTKNAQISVSDTGVGIEAGEVKRLFQKFHRGTSVKTYNYVGSGLGLYLTKLIISAHGGTISVDSQLNQGTTFTVSIPLES